MRKFKRIASVALIAIMMLQTVSIAAPVPSDVVGTEYEAAASMLCALEIMVGDGSKFNPDANITRAEFAQIMMKSLALDSVAQAFKPTGVFSDVPTANIFAPAIELGVGIGAIKGYGDGKFGPDDNVKGTEAVKMMTFAAGHDVVAEGNGGYPTGYMTVALDIGMLDGISNIDFSVPMTRGQAAILCANTLKVDMKKKVTTGGKITYVQKDGVNLLSEKHDTYLAEGIVTANDLTQLYEPSTLREGRVKINDTIYIAGATNIGEELGKYVKAYYKYDEEAEESTIVSYTVVDAKNIIQKTALSNIVSGYTSSLVKYWADIENDTKPTEVDITPLTPSVILNGVATSAGLLTTLNNTVDLEGEIVFIDSKDASGNLGSDGKADVILITAYDTIVVNGIVEYETSYYIKNKMGAGKEYDLEAPGVVSEIIDGNGAKISLGDIFSGEVISVAESDDGTRKRIKMILSSTSFEGEITEKSKKNGIDMVTIDGKKYKISKQFAQTTRYINEITIGRKAVFSLDTFGRIVYAGLASTGDGNTFGLLTQYVDGVGFDNSLNLRIYSDGSYKDYKTAEKVIIDGNYCKEPSDMKKKLDTALANVTANVSNSGATGNGYFDESATVTPLLYKVNEEGEITEIDTPYQDPIKETAYSLSPVTGTSLSFMTAKYNSGASMIANKYSVSKNTPYISLPVTFTDLEQEKKISAGAATGLPANIDINLQMFTTEGPSSKKAEYVIMKSTDGALTDYDYSYDLTFSGTKLSKYMNLWMFVVSDVVQVLDENGAKTVKITGLMEGSEREYMVDAEYFASEFKSDIWDATISQYDTEALPLKDPMRDSSGVIIGDAIRVSTNAEGKVAWAEAIYLSDVKIARSRNETDFSANYGQYRDDGLDVAVVYEKDNEIASMRYLISKNGHNSGVRNPRTTMITTNSDGFILSAKSKDSALAQDKTGWNLYDETNNKYRINDTETGASEGIIDGFAADASYDVSKFKIMVYNPRKAPGKQIYAGTENDLFDTDIVESRNNPASLVIMQFRRDGTITSPKGMYIIKF